MNTLKYRTPADEYPLKLGLFGIGLDAYWPQFPGLRERLEGYLGQVDRILRENGAAVVNLGLIDTPDAALMAGHRFRREDVDLLFLYVTTYALSSTVLPVVHRAGVPVIVLNLSPEQAIDYRSFNSLGDRRAMTGEWLAHCQACPLPEIANVFMRAGIPFHQVTGVLQGDELSRDAIREWALAAKIAHGLFHNRLGLMGHYYSGMLDIYTDLTGLMAAFGGHIEIIEVDELAALRREQSEQAVSERVSHFTDLFEVQSGCDPEELRKAARTSLALEALAGRHRLGAIAYYYKGTGNPDNEEAVSSIILGNSLLTAQGVPVAGEYEVKNVLAMKILDILGAGGSFTEYYAVDYLDDVVLMGHDGPGHIAIAEGKVKVRPLEVYHGKVGKGLSVEMSVRHGPVTLLSVVQQPGEGVMLLVAEGESVPGPILEIGNTNSRYRFAPGVKAFMEAWNACAPAHHCAVGTGYRAAVIEKLGALLGLEVRRVC